MIAGPSGVAPAGAAADSGLMATVLGADQMAATPWPVRRHRPWLAPVAALAALAALIGEAVKLSV